MNFLEIPIKLTKGEKACVLYAYDFIDQHSQNQHIQMLQIPKYNQIEPTTIHN